jgi:hypothetical protein
MEVDRTVLLGRKESEPFTRVIAEALAGSVKLFANVTTSSSAWSIVKKDISVALKTALPSVSACSTMRCAVKAQDFVTVRVVRDCMGRLRSNDAPEVWQGRGSAGQVA